MWQFHKNINNNEGATPDGSELLPISALCVVIFFQMSYLSTLQAWLIPDHFWKAGGKSSADVKDLKSL